MTTKGQKALLRLLQHIMSFLDQSSVVCMIWFRFSFPVSADGLYLWTGSIKVWPGSAKDLVGSAKDLVGFMASSSKISVCCRTPSPVKDKHVESKLVQLRTSTQTQEKTILLVGRVIRQSWRSKLCGGWWIAELTT